MSTSSQLSLGIDLSKYCLKPEDKKPRKDSERREFTNSLACKFGTSTRMLGIKTAGIPLQILKEFLGSAEESKNVKAAFYSKIKKWNLKHENNT